MEFEKKFKIDSALKELEGDRITVGIATCGLSAGAGPVLKTLKDAGLGLVVEGVGCAGACFAEPIVTVKKEGVFSIYGYVTKDKVGILIDCVKKGKVCEELLLGHSLEDIEYYKKQKKQVMANCGTINPFKIEQYIAKGGYTGLKNALSMKPEDVIEEVKSAGLRGRGGAGFPTGVKWGFFAVKKGKKYLICNGDEGDPGAFMNRTVMESDPFRLVEGMTIAAHATRCDEGIIYTRAEYPLAIETLERVLEIARKNNLLGNDIMDVKGFNFDIRIMKGAGAFVCGEETALMRSIEGDRGNPMPRPPYPAEKGVFGKPTNINNVGTYSNIPLIMTIGAKKYAEVGYKNTKGTKVICLTGNVKRTGVIEVPMGITLREIVFDIGGGCPGGKKFKAIQSGGPSGGCIPESKLDTPLNYENLQELGAIIGSGGMVVMDEETSMVSIAKYFMHFAMEESCGKCTPCREGTKRLHEMLTKVMDGLGDKETLADIKKLAYFVKDNSLCGLGQTAPNPILSTMNYFYDEYEACSQKKKPVEYHITDKCVGCGNCARHCPVEAISGKLKDVHVINQDVCVKCGLCMKNCAFHAIVRE